MVQDLNVIPAGLAGIADGAHLAQPHPMAVPLDRQGQGSIGIICNLKAMGPHHGGADGVAEIVAGQIARLAVFDIVEIRLFH